jgi:hypothetical protein
MLKTSNKKEISNETATAIGQRTLEKWNFAPRKKNTKAQVERGRANKKFSALSAVAYQS